MRRNSSFFLLKAFSFSPSYLVKEEFQIGSSDRESCVPRVKPLYGRLGPPDPAAFGSALRVSSVAPFIVADQIGTEILLQIVCEFFPKICLIDNDGGNSDEWPGTNSESREFHVRPASVSVRLLTSLRQESG